MCWSIWYVNHLNDIISCSGSQWLKEIKTKWNLRPLLCRSWPFYMDPSNIRFEHDSSLQDHLLSDLDGPGLQGHLPSDLDGPGLQGHLPSDLDGPAQFLLVTTTEPLLILTPAKHSPEWVRTSNPVIGSPVRYIWTTAPTHIDWSGAH